MARSSNTLAIRLPPEVVTRLDELADQAGVSRTVIAREILAELVPRISTVRRRVAISFTKSGE